MITIAKVEKFFYWGIVVGWVAGGVKRNIPLMPGYVAIYSSDGDFTMVDQYCKTPYSHKSAGTTTIFYQKTPVWVMNYGGEYDPKAIHFLKGVLINTYGRKEFFGGRGPEYFQDEESHMVYFNRPLFNSFDKFEGREKIIDHDGSPLGYHDYWGMSLLC